jgi:hypothetical protein
VDGWKRAKTGALLFNQLAHGAVQNIVLY